MDGACGLAGWERRWRRLGVEKASSKLEEEASSKLDVENVSLSRSSFWTLGAAFRCFLFFVLGQ